MNGPEQREQRLGHMRRQREDEEGQRQHHEEVVDLAAGDKLPALPRLLQLFCEGSSVLEESS
ncbi:MAG: hypothetical protein WDN72_03950 [Alphaproteobacteria bacterium]